MLLLVLGALEPVIPLVVVVIDDTRHLAVVVLVSRAMRLALPIACANPRVS